MNTASSRKPLHFELHQFFGQVQYYFVHRFQGEDQILAYIENAQNVKKNKDGTYTFEKYGIFEFVNVNTIQKCVGFWKVGKIYTIIIK